MSIDIKIKTNGNGTGKSTGILVGEAQNGTEHSYPSVTIDTDGYVHVEGVDANSEITVQITYGE